MTKKERLLVIKTLIENYEISTQEELTQLLTEKGYNVSQSTISRDMNELGLTKVAGLEKKFKYACADIREQEVTPQMISLFNQVTLSMENANNLIVIKTLAGNAGTAGMVIDQMHFKCVLGTVAGDDTLLVIAKSNSDAEMILRVLRNI
ncbi:MAG: arginine repressor [Clostridiales bacterium]|nr:arginine repressor [Clostridiales bacterium]